MRAPWLVALSALALACAWPQLSLATRGVPAAYGPLTAVIALMVFAIVATCPDDRARTIGAPGALPVAVAVVAATVIVAAAYRWTQLMAWLPYHADMLIVLREATRRFLIGHDPYTTYRSWDAPWDMAMPYGPALWGPYLATQAVHADFRMITIVGELFVPAWCGVCATVEAARRHFGTALAWLALTIALIGLFDLQRFTLIGHTPVYWPWLMVFAAAVSARRWVAAACVLGVLLVARSTMVAIVPVFLMAIWQADRRSLGRVLIAMTAVAALALLPFALWDAHALWNSMVASYPRVMKVAVWPALAKPGLETVGLTEWLIEHGKDWLVFPAQGAAMAIAYAAAWFAVARSRPALPWMAFALFVFSATSLYPVHYLYYDVLLLLTTAGIAAVRPPGSPLSWTASLALLVLLVAGCLRATTTAFPQLAVGDAPTTRMLRSGFDGLEHDGERGFAWAIGHEARVALPRTSAADADIVLTGESALDAGGAPQHLTAILNGSVVADADVPAGPREIRLRVPTSTWWIGFNDLQLLFSSAVSPREAHGAADDRPLAFSLSRISVTPVRP